MFTLERKKCHLFFIYFYLIFLKKPSLSDVENAEWFTGFCAGKWLLLMGFVWWVFLQWSPVRMLMVEVDGLTLVPLSMEAVMLPGQWVCIKINKD